MNNNNFAALFGGAVLAVMLCILFTMNADVRSDVVRVDVKAEKTALDLRALELRVNMIEHNTQEMLDILRKLWDKMEEADKKGGGT